MDRVGWDVQDERLIDMCSTVENAAKLVVQLGHQFSNGILPKIILTDAANGEETPQLTTNTLQS